VDLFAEVGFAEAEGVDFGGEGDEGVGGIGGEFFLEEGRMDWVNICFISRGRRA